MENGDSLTATEFIRRFNSMPQVKKAELVQGTVYMASPVNFVSHGHPDFLAQAWLSHYSIMTPGTQGATNTTARLGPLDVPQPDILLRFDETRDGQSSISEDGYLIGAPELAFEIAASSASLDAGSKKISYLQAGVKEYILWRTIDQAIEWFYLEDDQYQSIEPDEDGIMRSRTFPGLWMDPQAILHEDGPKLIASLNLGLASDEHAEFVAKA